MNIFCISYSYTKVNLITFGLEFLLGQNKHFKEVIFGFWKLKSGIFKYFLTFYRADNQSSQEINNAERCFSTNLFTVIIFKFQHPLYKLIHYS